MAASNPTSEARNVASKLGNAAAALTQAMGLPAATPYRAALAAHRDEIQALGIAIQEQAMRNEMLGPTSPADYGMAGPAGMPPMMSPPGPGATEGPMNPAFAQAMMGGLNERAG